MSCRFQRVAEGVSRQLGGVEKVDQLHINAKEVKKIAMKSIKRSLSEVLPVSLEEHRSAGQRVLEVGDLPLSPFQSVLQPLSPPQSDLQHDEEWTLPPAPPDSRAH